MLSKRFERLKALQKHQEITAVMIDIPYGNETIRIHSHPYDIMSNKIMFGKFFATPKFYEIEILEYIKSKFPYGGVALDIGANIGNHSIFFSKFIFDTTYAFEPNLKNYTLLSHNKAVNNIGDDKLIIINTALSDNAHKYNLIEYDNHNMGSSTISEGDGEFLTQMLDDFQLPTVDFIKLDVEGHELKVLRGGINLIKRDFPDIIMESMENGYNAPEKIDPYMKSIGYRMIESFGDYSMYYYKHL